jgi:hypothetical protein
VNGGRDQGSHLDDVFEELAFRGALPTQGQGFNHEYVDIGWKNRLPRGWEETAIKFRIDPSECFEITNHVEAVTAWLLGYAVSSGRRGHAMVEVQYYYKDGKLWRKDLGSWGMGPVNPDYNDGYHHNLVNAREDEYYEMYGAWAARSIILPT